MKLISKLSLSLATLSIFAVACQKKDVDIDPRDQYVGTYIVNGTQTLTAISIKQATGVLTSANVIGAKVLITKDYNAQQVKLTTDGNPDLVAILENNTFYIPPQDVQDKTATGYAYYRHYEGRGSFVNNKIILTTVLSATTDQTKTRFDTDVTGNKQ